MKSVVEVWCANFDCTRNEHGLCLANNISLQADESKLECMDYTMRDSMLSKDKLAASALTFGNPPDLWSVDVKNALHALKKEYLQHYPSELEEFEELLDKWFPVFKEKKI